MASGRRDYTWGFLSETAAEGRYCESVNVYSSKSVISGCSEKMYQYEVPEGYRLLVNKVVISTESRDVNIFWVRHGLSVILYSYFSDFHIVDFTDRNPFVFEHGYDLIVYITNKDVSAKWFYVCIVGVLEQLT